MHETDTPTNVGFNDGLGPLVGRGFIARTNTDYAAWCKTYYQSQALDPRGMVSLHGLWAWQEQERRMDELRAELAAMRSEAVRQKGPNLISTTPKATSGVA